MQNIETMNINTKRKPLAKNHAKIVLAGNFNINSNIIFEVYRKAVEHDVTGYIKFREDDSSEIVAEAESKAVETFIQWLISFIQNRGIHVNLHWSDHISNYKEFRIIH